MEKKARRPYQWGRYDILRELEKGQVLRLCSGTKKDTVGWSTSASRLSRMYGAKICVHYYKGSIYAVRLA